LVRTPCETIRLAGSIVYVDKHYFYVDGYLLVLSQDGDILLFENNSHAGEGLVQKLTY